MLWKEHQLVQLQKVVFPLLLLRGDSGEVEIRELVEEGGLVADSVEIEHAHGGDTGEVGKGHRLAGSGQAT